MATWSPGLKGLRYEKVEVISLFTCPKTKWLFWGSRHFFNHSLSNCSDWLNKSRPPKKANSFMGM